MYNSSYEEYMANVLGYNIRPQNTYQGDIYEMQPTTDYEDMSLEALYPETYRMIYPMVQKVCMRATGVINEELISDMTNEVYNAMVERETRQSSKELQKSSSEIRSGSSQSTRKVEETRQNNFMLRDLIRILIIRELLRRRRRPGRPPMRPPIGQPYPMM